MNGNGQHMTPKKKLIEVALPLEAINTASAREKSIRHGHPSTLHLWWARRPLAAARAVIFAQMVDDPSGHPERFPTEEAQETERQRLFKLIEQLVLWENTTDETVLAQAREEIWKSWRATCAENQNHPRAQELFDPEKLPAFHDPFAGGGTLPLEAQRLGLESYASDLNPVAVLINKAMIEIPPKFAGRPPINTASRKDKGIIDREWRGAQGLAEDVRYYGQWIRGEAEKRIGHFYPKVVITAKMAKERPDLKLLVGKKFLVIAWLWARTVKSPNPAFANVDVPLASNFILATKPGKEAYVEPVISGDDYYFTVKVGKPENAETPNEGTKAGPKGGFRCLMSNVPIPFDYIRAEASAGRMSQRLMAIVAEGDRARVYLPPTPEMEAIAKKAEPTWLPNTETFGKCRVNIGLYGLTTWDMLFTARQLVALTMFADLVQEARERVKGDAVAAGLLNDGRSLNAGGAGATAYSDAMATYLGIAVSRYSNAASTICTWNPGLKKEDIRFTFSRQALAMTWDFAEGNPFSDSSGNVADSYGTWVYKALTWLPRRALAGASRQVDAATQNLSVEKIVSTDPPYYNNIGYADLSDFFYLWLRRALKPVFPDLFSTLATPKAEELVATPYRHGTREKAEAFFLNGMTQAMHRLAEQAHPAFPVTIYYAFKQAESDGDEGIASTGWDTFLSAVILAGFAISGTWPMRTERGARSVGIGTNALASSIVLVCRKGAANAPTATRREFLNQLKAELPEALKHLQRSNIAPVDLAQAAIGPGMAVYSRYAKVLDAEGETLSVREALALINQTLDEALAEQEGDFDGDSRWALAWFEQSGFAEGEYGVAETLSKAKNTSVSGMVEAGILRSKGGKVRLLRPGELPPDWDPETDLRLTAWESVHHLVRALEAGGEIAAAQLVAKIGSKAEISRELAYRLYTVCERKKRAQEALSYNGLVQSWPEITRLAREGGEPQQSQPQLFDQE
jgi:putative DNA methylase